MFNAITKAFVIAAAEVDNRQVIFAAGKQSKFKEGWSASLSHKTYMQLKNQGIMK